LAAESHWRLTDRGIGVILVAAAMIVAAALMVVSVTAFRVTGDNYQPHPQWLAQSSGALPATR